ncbi:MAG: hypothetical protein QF805_07475, partial [Pirellulaceae bacterium]|nr:hypothetical protein [Pirellulaceae bacterium]
RVADPPTKQYELDETDRMALDETSVKPQAEVESTNDAEADDEDPPEVSESTSDTGKKKPGKLPLLKSSPTTENSRQAAADMLKKFFNRT